MKKLCLSILICLLNLHAHEVTLTAKQQQEVISLFSKEGLSEKVTELYISCLEKNTVSAVHLPNSFWKWVRSNESIRSGLFNSRYSFSTETVKRLHSYWHNLKSVKANRYSQLLLAFSVCERPQNIKKNVESEGNAIYSYIEKRGLDFIDAYKEKNKIEKELGLKLAKGDRERVWDAAALRAGLFPAAEKFSDIEFLSYLIDHYESDLKISPVDNASVKKNPKDYSWPAFPIDKAPWPLMMTLSRSPGKKCAEYVWQRFKKGFGVTRYKNYSFNYKKPEVRFKPSTWNPGSIFRIIEDGGVCGRQSALCIGSNTALGIPSMSLYQPGHVAVLYYDTDENNKYITRMKQSTSQLKVSQADWFFQDISGFSTLKRKDRPMIRCGVEYHCGLSLAVNKSLESWVRTRTAVHITKFMNSDNDKIKLLESAFRLNPFNVDVIYRLAKLYGNNTSKIYRIIRSIKSLSSGGSVLFEESHSASADLTYVKEVKSSQDELLKRWSELMVFRLFKFGFTEELLQPERSLQYVSEELKRQQKVRRSPYLKDIQLIKDRLEIKLNGPERYVQKLLRMKVPWIGRIKKLPRKRLHTSEMIGEISLPLQYMDSKSQLEYLSTLRKAFHPQRTYFGEKKTPHPLYKFLTSKELKLYRSLGEEYKAAADLLREEIQERQK